MCQDKERREAECSREKRSRAELREQAMAYHGMSDTYENVLFIIDDVSAPSTANVIMTDLVN